MLSNPDEFHLICLFTERRLNVQQVSSAETTTTIFITLPSTTGRSVIVHLYHSTTAMPGIFDGFVAKFQHNFLVFRWDRYTVDIKDKAENSSWRCPWNISYFVSQNNKWFDTKYVHPSRNILKLFVFSSFQPVPTKSWLQTQHILVADKDKDVNCVPDRIAQCFLFWFANTKATALSTLFY